MSVLRAHCVHDFGERAFTQLRAAVDGAVVVTVGVEIPSGGSVESVRMN